MLEIQAPFVEAAVDPIITSLLSEFEKIPEYKDFVYTGIIQTEPDPSQPGAELMKCIPGEQLEGIPVECISLDNTGAFIRVEPVTWETARFYMFRIFIHTNPGSEITPAKNFVGLDIFSDTKPEIWEKTTRAVRQAVKDIGAVPYQP